MRCYEIVFIARQELTANQVESITQEYTKVIQSYDGEVSKTEFCGLRTLAYAIKKNKKGHYVLLNVLASSEAIKEVERQMRLSDDVLRYLSVRVDVLDNNPSTLMQSKNFKEDYRNDNDDALFDSVGA